MRHRVRNCVTPIRIPDPHDMLNRIPLAEVAAVVSLFVFWCWFVGPFVCVGGGFVVGVWFFFFFKLALGKVVRAPTPNGALK